MKVVLRIFLYIIFAPIIGLFLLIKKYGNKAYKLEKGTVIVANHYSDWDAFLIYLLYGFKNKLYFFTADRVKKNLFTKIFCAAFNCLYVSNDPVKNISLLKNSIKLLKDGGIIVIFPEGAINDTKSGFFMFNDSFAFLAKKANANILPLFIYPYIRPFKKNLVYIGDVFNKEKVNSYDDMIILSMAVQARIMDYSVFIEEERNKKKNKKEKTSN